MIADFAKDNRKASRLAGNPSSDLPSPSPGAAGPPSGRRETRASWEDGVRPPTTRTMASADSGQAGSAADAPLVAASWARSLLYKVLCFLLLVSQGGLLDFYLIAFTDLYWCSWIATDLVVVSGWALFFVKNARGKRERACGFRQKGSPHGGAGAHLGEFTYAYLAWLVHVMAFTPKAALVLETSILDLVALQVPLGLTGFKAVILLSAPLLFCLLNAVAEDLNGAIRHRSQSCFTATCLDLLDSFSLVEALLRNGDGGVDDGPVPAPYLKHAATAVYLTALAAPVVWLYELAASAPRRRWLWARLVSTGLLVNAPLLAVRCFQVYAQRGPVSVFMFKNVFFLACGALELSEQCVAARARRRARFSRGVSENDMCPHGYVNTLAVAQS
ncbi:transmembrane protein 121B [Stigmatopora nigra]